MTQIFKMIGDTYEFEYVIRVLRHSPCTCHVKLFVTHTKYMHEKEDY
jgi:hypothetical protein